MCEARSERAFLIDRITDYSDRARNRFGSPSDRTLRSSMTLALPLATGHEIDRALDASQTGNRLGSCRRRRSAYVDRQSWSEITASYPRSKLGPFEP